MKAGERMSEEQKSKISAANTGKRRTDEQRARISQSIKGRKLSPEHCKKISENNKGKIISDETRQKQRIAVKNRPPISEETRRKLSESHKGQKPSKETLIKRSIALRGKLASNKGIPHTYQARLRIVETMIGGFWYGNVRYYANAPQYCEKFNANLKERVRAFFGYQCVICGKKQGSKKLDVHHVWYNKKACCDDTPRSLVPLCHECHTKTTRGDRAFWSRLLQDMIDTRFEGRCWFTKEEMNQRGA